MRLAVVVLAVVVGVALAAPFAKDKTRVWKPKAIRDKEAAEALTATPAVAYDATAAAETRVILPGGPTVVEESTGAEPAFASVKAEEPAQSDVAEVKAVPPKPKIEWLIAEEESVAVVAPLVVEAETPKEEAVHDHFETAADTVEEASALEAKSDSEPVAYTAPALTTVQEVKAAPEPTIAHEPVVETVAEETPEEPIAVAIVAPVEETHVAPAHVAPVVATEEKKEYEATALVEKTETEPVATYPTANVAAEEEVVKSEPVVEPVVVPTTPATSSISPATQVSYIQCSGAQKCVSASVCASRPGGSVGTPSGNCQVGGTTGVCCNPAPPPPPPPVQPVVVHSDVVPAAVSIATVDPVVEEVVATVPVADLTVEEQVVEFEPEIVPVEAAPVVIVLDEPAAAIVEAIVPSTKTETISY